MPIIGAAALTNCGTHSSTMIPAAGDRAALSVAVSQGGTPSFSTAMGAKLTSAQLDAYIDSSVSGNDRVLARRLMGYMPPGMRGDFVYIRNDGTLLSNRPAVLKETSIRVTANAGPRAANVSRKTESVVTPPPASALGPYVRQYSALGIDAAFGYATIDCNDWDLYEDNGASDNGEMYLGGFGNAGNGSGIDAGLQVSPTGSIQPFLNVSALGGYQSVQYNGSAHYGCGGNGVGIMYGGLPEPSVEMFLATGVPPYPGDTYIQPPSTVVWSNPAWTFWSTPADFSNQGTDSTGAASPCGNCITKRMTSIAQKVGNYYSSDACFGACNGYPGNRWDQVVMGQLQLPCMTAPPSGYPFTCTIVFQTNNSWFGGYQYYPDAYVAQADEVSPNMGFEGLDLSQDDQTLGVTRRPVGVARGPFSYIPVPTPTPIPCKRTPCGGCLDLAPAAAPQHGGGSGASPDITCPQAVIKP